MTGPPDAGSISSVLWRRLDRRGHDAARLSFHGSTWRLEGTAIFEERGRPCRLDYRVTCGPGWETRTARVEGWIGDETVSIDLARDSEGRWRVGCEARADLAGCLDVDFAFTPATNLLPIRRLALAPGRAAAIDAAWLDVPDLAIRPLDQVYRRIGPATYRFESGHGSFTAELAVREDGFVVLYPGLWEAETTENPG